MQVPYARVHVANLLIISSLFSLMALNFYNGKFKVLIWEDSEYRFVLFGLFLML